MTLKLKPPGRGVRGAMAATPPLGLGLTSERARAHMVERVRQHGVQDNGVLAALGAVERHRFVDQALASRAYEDVALPIGHEQTISRPTVVATMLAAVSAPLQGDARKRARVLEIGTGCGWQAAVMARLFGEVYSIERIRGLHEAARKNLAPLRLGNLRLAFGDGREGLPQVAPFDAIVIAAAGIEVPDELMRQMAVGARLIAPVGAEEQALHLVERVGHEDWHLTVLEGARFVPLREGTA
jgi:protein-L-isoaspartate(D-aspartate) O-methyltransferase